VALKAYPAHASALPGVRAAVELESALQARAAPFAPRPFEIGTAEGCLFLAEEWIEGSPLAFQADPAAALRTAGELCRAVAAVHEAGIVHNDLKPANVLKGAGGIRLLDFGAARRPGNGDPRPLQHCTPGYAAPEVFAGEEPSAASDVFALGCTLAELLGGRRVLAAGPEPAYWGTLARLRSEGPLPLLAYLPPGVAHVLARCLAFDPEGRIGSVQEVAELLARCAPR
jgi:serine/threonine protein kinase